MLFIVFIISLYLPQHSIRLIVWIMFGCDSRDACSMSLWHHNHCVSARVSKMPATPNLLDEEKQQGSD